VLCGLLLFLAACQVYGICCSLFFCFCWQPRSLCIVLCCEWTSWPYCIRLDIRAVSLTECEVHNIVSECHAVSVTAKTSILELQRAKVKQKNQTKGTPNTSPEAVNLS
jgi:hypothetical protein